MSKTVLILFLTSLSCNALADPYQQMASSLNDLIDIMAKKSSSKNEYQDSHQVNYTNSGSFSYGSDGSSYYNTEDRSYGNNGNTYYQMNDNSGYGSNGSNYQRVGDYIYINNADGSRTVCYVSNVGTQCR